MPSKEERERPLTAEQQNLFDEVEKQSNELRKKEVRKQARAAMKELEERSKRDAW